MNKHMNKRNRFTLLAAGLALAAAITAPSGAGATVFPAEGGRGDAAMELHCPADYFLVGFKGRAGNWIDQISLVCRKLEPPDYMSGPQTISASLGGPGGSPAENLCERGSAINRVGLLLRSESYDPKYVNGIAFSCHRPRDGAFAGDRAFGFGNWDPSARGWSRITAFSQPTAAYRGVIHTCPGSEYASGLNIRYGRDVNAIGLICANFTDPEGEGFDGRAWPGMEDNSDRPGSDYNRIERNGMTPEACQRACRDDPQRCRAWTYVRPGVQIPNAVCYLKSAAPARQPNKCCISGVEAGSAPPAPQKPVTGLGKKKSAGAPVNPSAANSGGVASAGKSGATAPNQTRSADVRPRCKSGFVWREARSTDYVCVPPEARDRTARENAEAAARRDPNGAYGPNTCIPGYVWREAFDGDVVCVTPDIRAQVREENRLGPQRTQ